MKKILLFFLALSSLFLFSARSQTNVVSCDFEDSSQDTVWHFVNGSSGWYIGAAAGVNNTYGGTRALYVSNDNGISNAYSSSSNSWAYMDVAVPTGYAELTLEFDWKCYGESGYDYMKVYVGTPSTPSGTTAPSQTTALVNDLRTSNTNYFNGYDGISYSLYPGWNHYSYTVQGSVYGGQTIRIYLYWHSDGSVTNQPPMAVDNLVLIGSQCRSVSNLMTDPTTYGFSATFTPSLPTDNQWEYICVPADSSIVNETPIPITDSSFTVGNLNPNTDYDVYIRTDCGAENSIWKRITTHTTCVPYSLLPFYDGFDSIPTGTNSYPECWAKINTYTGGQRPYVNSTHYEGTGSLYFYAGSGTYNIAVMPPIDASIQVNTLMVTFMYRNSSVANNLIVGVMNNPTDSATFVPVDTIQYNTAATWHEFEVAFNNYTGNGQYIAFLNQGGTSDNAAYIDNVGVDVIPVCMKPVDVTISAITQTGATVTWTPRGTETSWEIAVVPFGEDPNLTIPEVTTTYSYVLTELMYDTRYQVYVRSNCDADGYSNWTPYETFRTACPDYLIVPYTENFDSYGSGSYLYPQCWSRLTNSSTNYPYLSSSYYVSENSSLYFYASTATYSIALSPIIDTLINPINTLSVTFKLLKTSTSSGCGRCEIGVMSDPANAATFTPITTVLPTDLSDTYTWYEFDYQLTNYTGTGAQYLAFRAPAQGYNDLYLDDVTIYSTPSCLKPLSVTLSNLSSNSVTVNWNPRNNETAWNVAVVPTGTDVSSATPEYAATRPYTVSGLTDNTTYDVYVQADCGNGDMSTWSSVVTFNTLCLPTTIIPYTENFDSCATGSSAALPGCWLKYTNYTTAYPYPSDSYHSSGSNAIYFFSGSSYYSYLVSQALDLSAYPAGSLHLTCQTLKSSSEYGRLDIGYMTDPSDLSTFVLLKSVYPSDYAATSTWYLRDVVINQDFTSPIYLAFVAPQGGSSYTYLDDVSLDYLADCSDPSSLEISEIAGSSALVSWTASLYGASDYTVEYSEAGLDNWTIAAVVTGTQTFITGLLPTTSYDVRVSANCSSSISNYITRSFNTNCLAGGDVSIGTGTGTSSVLPTNGCYNYSYTQQLYTGAEVGADNMIRGISFNLTSTTGEDNRNLTIYLANTDQTALSASSYIPLDSLTQVYTGTVNFTLGWNVINFTTFFPHDGRNIVVAIDDNTGSYACSPEFATSSGSTSLYRYNDNINIDPASPGSFNITSNRNNIKVLSACDSLATCIAPNAFISDVDDQSATLSWAPGNSETSWEIEYKVASDSVWIQTSTVTSSPYDVTGLTAGTDYLIRIRSICTPDNSDWVTLSFSTECTPAILPLIENFDSASGSGAGNFISCWSRGTNNGATAYPYTSSSQNVSAPYSLYFYGSSAYYSYAVSPRFDDAVQMDSLQVAFQMYKTSASYFIEVGIMTDPTDFNTFVSLGMVTPTTTNTWQLAEINTSAYSGTGQYVAFRVPEWVSNYMFIDDIIIQYIPSCARVNDLGATNILAHSATVFWSAGSDETSWDYLYGPAGTVNLDTDVPTTITTNSVPLTGLIDNTIYDVYVRGLCQNGEYSAWTALNFRTACDEVSTLPYSENFDSYNTGSSAFPSCWSKYSTYSNYPYISSTNYSAPGSLYFYTGGSGTYNLAIMTPIATTIPMNTLQVSFQYRNSSITSQMMIGVMSNPLDPSTFVPVDTVSNPSTSTWYQQRVSLANYTGTGQYIAFKTLHSTTYTSAYIDNLQVDLLPSCGDPSNFTVSNLTATTAELVWQDAAGESSWQLLVVADGVTPNFANAVSVTSSPYSCTGLVSNTIYHAYLRTVCSNGLGYSNWINTSFMTISANPAQTPYFHDFDDGTENAEWVLMNGSCDNKWFIGQPTGETDSILFISNDNGISNAYNINSSSNVWAYRDIHFGPGAEFNLSIQWRTYAESCCDYLRFYIGTPMPVTPGSSITIPDGVTLLSSNLNNQSSWQEFSYLFDNSYANTIKRLYILWHNDGSAGSTPPGAIDSIEITVSDCGRPYNVAATSMTTTTADIGFTPAVANDMTWQYVVGLPGFNPDQSTPVDITTTPFQITNLTAGTEYEVYVRTACNPSGYSSWSVVSDFSTMCDNVTIPYSYNFDSDNTGSSADFPTCWTRINYGANNYYPYVSSSYAYSGSNSLFCHTYTSSSYSDSYAVLPAFDATSNPINTLQLSFYARQQSSSAEARLIVGIMNSAVNINSFTPIDTLDITSTTFEEYIVMFNGYTGTGSFIAIKCPMPSVGNYNNNIYLDNIYLETIPSCPRPNYVTATSVTNTTVTLSWHENGSAMSWEVLYGPDGFDPATAGTLVNASTNPFTIPNLTASTTYDFYVRAICSATDTSNWSNVVTASTACEAITAFPYTEDFENAGNMPSCWSQNYVSGNVDWDFISGDHRDISSAHGGSYNALFYYEDNETTHSTKLVSPVFDLTQTTNPYASFWHTQAVWISDQDVLTVYYRTNATATWTQLTQYTSNISAWTFDSLALPNPSATYQLAFEGTAAYGYGIAIDDITVASANGSATTCDAPTGLTSAVTANTATVSWTENGNFEVAYKLSSANTWSSNTAVAGSTTTLTGLTANTAYDWRVRKVCDATTHSTWATGTFTTTAESSCPMPTDLAVTDVDSSSATIAWTQEAGTATEWTLNYRRLEDGATWTSSTISTNPYTIVDLLSLTSYEMQIRANCTDGTFSEYTDVVTFTTTGIDEYNLSNSISLYPNPTSSYIDVKFSDNIQVSELKVYDVYGKLLQTIAVNENPTRINVSDFADGVYFVRAITKDGIANKSFIKR